MGLTTTFDDLSQHVGADLGRSSTREIHQETIDDFARLTGDHQWIHTDPERAAAGPFGQTIAHGFLTLSLIAPFLEELFVVHGVSGQINYGLNKVRFPRPVRVGSRLHARGDLKAVEVREGSADAVLALTIWTDDSEAPSCAAEIVVRLFA